MIDQALFMHQFNDTHREQFNPDLFKRDNDEMVDAIHAVLESCQRDKYYTLKLLSFESIYDYEEIYNTLRNHEERRRKKNNKDENNYDFINIRDTDMILIKVKWLVRHNGVERQEEDNTTKEVVNPETVLEVLIAIPRFVKKYYFKLAGNYYTTTFQIVDGSTYNNSTASQSKVDTVTLKTMFMPIRVFRSFAKYTDVYTDKSYKLVEYWSIIFGNVVNALYYIIAAYGLYGASDFLQIHCLGIYDHAPENVNDSMYCFNKFNIFVTVPKECFQDTMVQTFIATILEAINKTTTVTDLYNQKYWLKSLGLAFKNATVEKGLFVLDSLDGIYDNTTKRDLHLPDQDKEDIYCLLRWLLREFSSLRVKENVDVSTKRIRMPEYIAALYAAKLNKGIHRISDMGSRVTLKKVIQAIYTQPMFLINSVSSMSNLVSYRDLVNDNDASVSLKYTYKGISGLGEDGTSIQPVYRYVDPSHIGILDLDTSSASDPGMSGIICPMTNLYGPDHSFSEYTEPNDWRNSYLPIEKEWDKKNKKNVRHPVTFDTPQSNKDFSSRRDEIAKEELDINKVYCPIKNINDPSIVYTCSQAILDQEIQEEKTSLFTIIPENLK